MGASSMSNLHTMNMRGTWWEITTRPNIKEASSVSICEQVIHVPARSANHYSVTLIATVKVSAVNTVQQISV
jgi:hypothetical protein